MRAAPVRALLVEDDVVFVEALRSLSDKIDEALELSHVRSLAELTALEMRRPDVVLLDLFLPDSHGVDSVRAVHDKFSGVPVVVLTADADQDLALSTVRGGAQDHLVKGRFDADALLRSVRYAIERAQSEQLRSRLLHADRLAAIGKLAAGVAHEISNPATFVQANEALLERELGQVGAALQRAREGLVDLPPASRVGVESVVERLEQSISNIERILGRNSAGIARICSVVSDLRSYSRLENPTSQRVSPNEVVHEACQLVEHVLKHHAELVKDLADVPLIAVPRARLEQVVTNLLVNAAQAVPEDRTIGNRITISTKHTDGEVVLAVEDNGCGMSDEHQSRIFEAFFTTKPSSQGTGLGLSICNDIVTAHGGSIRCRSALGTGSRFEVRFPPAQNQIPSLKPSLGPVPERDETERRPRVLLVDDEPNIRLVFQQLLEGDFEIETAGDGRQMLDMLERRPGFEALVCDVMMPDTDAASVVEILEARRPELMPRLILCTGGAVNERAQHLLDRVSVPVLYKPVSATVLKDAIDRLLRRNRKSA